MLRAVAVDWLVFPLPQHVAGCCRVAGCLVVCFCVVSAECTGALVRWKRAHACSTRSTMREARTSLCAARSSQQCILSGALPAWIAVHFLLPCPVVRRARIGRRQVCCLQAERTAWERRRGDTRGVLQGSEAGGASQDCAGEKRGGRAGQQQQQQPQQSLARASSAGAPVDSAPPPSDTSGHSPLSFLTVHSPHLLASRCQLVARMLSQGS